jgi:hypothetical protein
MVAGFEIVAFLAFSPAVYTWLLFAGGLHELREERALHAVDMRTNQTSPSGRTAEFAS